MEWFRKAKEGLIPQRKKEIPDGIWVKCDACGEIIYRKELEKHLWVCSKCDHHFRIRSKDYIDLILDDGRLEEFDAGLQSSDPLEFKDSKKYPGGLSILTPICMSPLKKASRHSGPVLFRAGYCWCMIIMADTWGPVKLLMSFFKKTQTLKI